MFPSHIHSLLYHIRQSCRQLEKLTHYQNYFHQPLPIASFASAPTMNMRVR